MNRAIQPWRVVLCAVLALLACVSARAQKVAVPSRVVETVDDTNTVTLKGNVHPLARAAYDQGAVPDSQPMTRMLLVLQRSSAQEQTLHQLMDAQQTKGSPSYQAWLTPEQFGAQFGPSDSDVQAVTDWLTRQGFQVANVAKGKSTVEFSGNAGQVRNAFQTDIHKYVVNGKEYMANTTDPSIPAALSPVVAGIAALHNFPKHTNIVNNGVYRRYQGSKQITPLFTYGNPAFYAIGPGDFNTIYNIPATATGAGQSIAVLAQTNINVADVTAYRAMFGLPAYSSSCSPGPCLSVLINGTDPGIADTDDEGESDLDVEWSGAIAPMANIYLVVTQTPYTLINPSQISLGVDLSALYAVDNNIAPIISDSYGVCEPFLLTAGNQYYNSIWEQAAAQGITVSVAAGDTGPAGCDPNDSVDPYAASEGVAVNGLASTPYNVAMGGTDFDPVTTSASSISTYWNTTSDTVNSALRYMPEITWDDSACALNYPGTPCTTVDEQYGYDIKAAGGGLSNCISATENSSNGNITCNKTNGLYGYAKPAYQTNLTPADSARDLPDLSLFSSNGGPLATGTGVAIVTCQSDVNPNNAACNLQTPYQDFSLVGGTSAAAPAFAAIMALVEQSTGHRQGNADYVLYNLAYLDSNYKSGACGSSLGQTPAATCVFNDVTKGNNSVACDAGYANCSNTASSGYGVVVCNATNNSDTGPNQVCPAVDNANPAFQSTAEYDLATGLGSLNVTNLLAKWGTASRSATTTTLTSPSGGSPSGSNFTATISVAPAPANNEPVSLLALDSSGNVLNAVGPFSLSSGSVSVKTNLLPPGTASVEGTYGGDTTLAASTSAPVSVGPVAGAGQSSTVTVNFVSFGSNGSINVGTGSQNFQYGSAAYILKIVVTGSNPACSFVQPATKPSNPCPTGTVSLFSNGTPQNNFISNGTATNTTSLNNQGFVEDQPINLSVGSYKLTATYSGDQNFSANSNSNSLSVTLTQASTTTTVSSSLSSITSGQTVTLTAIIGTSSSGVGPTGSVAFTNNGNSIGSATCTPTAYNPNTNTPAYCTATLSTAISSLYPPPGNPGNPQIPGIPLIIAVLSLLLFSLGLRFIPQTRRRAYTFVGLLAIALLVGVVAGCGGGGGGGGGSTRTIGASYPGDTNYTKSSGTTTIQIQ
jgi:subtilase family serine protease